MTRRKWLWITGMLYLGGIALFVGGLCPLPMRRAVPADQAVPGDNARLRVGQ